jgi:hypothetical protein
MRTRDDVEALLMRCGLPYEEVAPSTWVVKVDRSNIVVRLTEDIVVLRMKAIELSHVPAAKRESLFQTLLELNAQEMLSAAWGLADSAVVLTATLRLEDLDFSEFQGAIDDFSLAMANHQEALAGFRDAS